MLLCIVHGAFPLAYGTFFTTELAIEHTDGTSSEKQMTEDSSKTGQEQQQPTAIDLYLSAIEQESSVVISDQILLATYTLEIVTPPPELHVI